MEAETLLTRLTTAEDNLVERKPEGVNRFELRRAVVALANSTPDGASCATLPWSPRQGNDH